MMSTTTEQASAGTRQPTDGQAGDELIDAPTVELPVSEGASAASYRLRSILRGTRTRLLLTYVGLLSLSLVASLLIREVLVSQVESGIDAQLVQEVEELTRLVGGNDPTTGQPFGDDVEAIFRTFFSRNVPNQDEGQYAFVDGAPFLTNAKPPAELTADRALVESLRRLAEPRRTSVSTTAGRAEYLAVPIRGFDPASGEQVSRGVFVVAEFPAQLLARVDGTVTRIGVALLTVLLVASAVSWAAAGRVLVPLRQAIQTARSIQDTNLHSRIPVSGSDDIAELGRTFNAMLDRIERSAQLQRSFVSDAGHELRTSVGESITLGSSYGGGHVRIWVQDDGEGSRPPTRSGSSSASNAPKVPAVARTARGWAWPSCRRSPLPMEDPSS
jgi:signal transduction histidine kinase